MSIGELFDRLRSEGIRVDDECPVAMNVARELKISRFPSAAAPIFLRILERRKGERDFANLNFLGDRLGTHINRPSRVVNAEHLVCGVFPYLPHEKVTYKKLAAAMLLPKMSEVLAHMHEAGKDFVAQGRAAARPSALDLSSSQAGSDPAFSDYFRSVFLAIIQDKSPVAQHCDFTYANLGIVDGSMLVVFDWEQYGAVQYPGFDFATFLLSHHHHAGTVGQILKSPDGLVESVHRDFGSDFLNRLGLTTSDFTRVFPAYLYLFLTLKQDGFSVAINKRMQGMWRALRQSGSWGLAMLPGVN